MTRLLTAVGLTCFLGILGRTATFNCEDEWGSADVVISLLGAVAMTAALNRALPRDVFGRILVVPFLGVLTLAPVWGAAAFVYLARCPLF